MSHHGGPSRPIAGRLHRLLRYPVKSMQGEQVSAVSITADGLTGDRDWAIEDAATSLVASAKRPGRWGALLQCQARGAGDDVVVSVPTGATAPVTEPDAVAVLVGAYVGRQVHLRHRSAAAHRIERTDPDLAADVSGEHLRLGDAQVGTLGGAAPGSLFDFAPIHLVSTATLDHLASVIGAGGADERRFRPNLIVDIDDEPYGENTWVGRDITIGDVVLSVIVPTPRCAIPSLAQAGDLLASADTVRVVAHQNRVDIPGIGRMPCLGAYARVRTGGAVEVGMAISIAPA
ncbi:MOSC domain-containing protein [Haliangium sp.]|uniref:MOSC domain-containing protein n=1 Tax=Haliangium sp. TaxID=2663208 RepID=UPI003D10C314